MSEPDADGRLSPEARIWGGVAAVLLPGLLKVASFETLVGGLSAGRPALPTRSRDFRDEDLAEWVDGLLGRFRGPWRHTCLKRSAVLYFVLRSAGRPVEMNIGVRRGEGGALEAHAWLLKDGSVYLEPDPTAPTRHRVIARFPQELEESP